MTRFVRHVGTWALALTLTLGAMAVLAADPESGTIDDQNHVQTWEGDGPYVFPNAQPGVIPCEPPVTCDLYDLEVNLTTADPDNDGITVEIACDLPEADFDLYVYDSGGTVVASGTSATCQEIVFLPAVNGRYQVRVIPWAPLGASYAGTARFVSFEDDKSFLGFAGATGAATLLLLSAAAVAARRRTRRVQPL